MAKKETTEKPELERTYIIPLRKVYQRAPRWRRTPRAVKAVRVFVVKHMKATSVKMGKHLNLFLWKDGMKNPPHKVEVACVKDKEGMVTVEITGAPKEVKNDEKPAKKKNDKKEDVKDAPSEKDEERKKIEKEELNTIKKEKIPTPKEASVPKQVAQQPNAPPSKG
ncbi:MAG: 50S ribosomal protein L31e [Nanoarchaeota archaeon]|nr:50S ribosomal protein L31e [Nanoarchaeota archaeon]